MTLGDRLKKLRLQRGWSQQQLANKVFVSNRTISSWEQNKRDISYEQLTLIAKAFDINVQHFYVEQPIPQTGQVASITLRSFKTLPNLLILFYVATCLQYGLLLIPFSNPLHITLLSLFGWIGIASMMGSHWLREQKKSTQTWLFPMHQHIVYETSRSNASHRTMNWFFTSGLIVFLLPLFLYYGSWFVMLQRLETEGTLITLLSILFLVLLIAHCILILRSLVNQPFAKRLDVHSFNRNSGLRLLRAWVWGHLGVIIILVIFSLNWPYALLPIELVILRLVNEAFLLLYIPSFYGRILGYYALYHLIPPNFNKT
jgi:transcriptional regulator with XRE-family HTH domain